MMSDHLKRVLRLEQMFSGVSDPHSMGTTGLLGWVCVSHGVELYRRVRTARKIIRVRHGSLSGFKRALLQTALTAYHREKIERHFAL